MDKTMVTKKILKRKPLKCLEDAENDVRDLKGEEIKLNNTVTWLSDYIWGLDW
jgi:hypothetical protein